MRCKMLLLTVLIASCLGHFVQGETSPPVLDITPKDVNIFDDEESIVSISIHTKHTETEIALGTVNVEIEDMSIAKIVTVDNEIIRTNFNAKEPTYQFGVKILGNKIGRTTAVFNFTDSTNSSLNYTVSTSFTVTRRRTIFDNILSYLLGLLIVINNFGIGCNFDYSVGKELGKYPKPVLIGIACQFGILPLLSFVIGWLLIANKALAFGLLTMGCMSGGGLASLWCGLLDGNVTISLCLTLLTNVLALIVIPLWLVLLGPLFLDRGTMIPFVDLAVFSLLPIIPILLGVGLRKCAEMRSRNKVIEFAVRSIRPFSAVLYIFCVTYATIVCFYLLWDFAQNWKACLSGVSIPWMGGVLSFTTASVFKLPTTQAKTIALEVISVNTALAVVLLKNTLPEPEADISSVTPMLSFIFTQMPLFFVGLVVVMRAMFKTNNEASKTNHGSEDTVVDMRDSDQEEQDEQHEMLKLNNEISA